MLESAPPTLSTSVVVGGQPLIHVGEYALTRYGAAALRDHLGELLDLLP